MVSHYEEVEIDCCVVKRRSRDRLPAVLNFGEAELRHSLATTSRVEGNRTIGAD